MKQDKFYLNLIKQEACLNLFNAEATFVQSASGQSQVVTESQNCCSLLNNSFIKKALI